MTINELVAQLSAVASSIGGDAEVLSQLSPTHIDTVCRIVEATDTGDGRAILRLSLGDVSRAVVVREQERSALVAHALDQVIAHNGDVVRALANK